MFESDHTCLGGEAVDVLGDDSLLLSLVAEVSLPMVVGIETGVRAKTSLTLRHSKSRNFIYRHLPTLYTFLCYERILSKIVDSGVDKLPNKCTRVREKLLKTRLWGKN